MGLKRIQKRNDLCLLKHRCILCREKEIRKSVYLKLKPNYQKQTNKNTHILSDKLPAQARSPVILLSPPMAVWPAVLTCPCSSSTQHHLVMFSWSQIPADIYVFPLYAHIEVTKHKGFFSLGQVLGFMCNHLLP